MNDPIEIRQVNVTRYITPLREGGSLPAVADADDGFKYVVKFKGAGHGVKALIAELLGCEIGRFLGFKVPEVVFANLDEAFGRTEADEEIQDLLKGSQGMNIGLHFLSGAINFDPVVTTVDAQLASELVWFDAFMTNIDRTFRNTNMLMWNRELWLIDHGASLYFHHAFTNWEKSAQTPFAFIKDHVLLPQASQLEAANTKFSTILTPAILEEIVNLIPQEWLEWEGSEITADEIRAVYFNFFTTRLAHAEVFTKEAKHAREALV
ncbi:HipA family kinase [Flavimarina sp. Hel_I_48]|uniref:HipA family kinase n=1 Tax=Flavimarina sp. Hel_I_48 TaxID=1392488 RepID=UPI0004DEECF4|nr:HipA family kinase [Flavimarina sp. Hel_I_48]